MVFRASAVPGFEEELVLDEECDGEHDQSLDGHGTQVLPHHVPAQRVFKTVFPWKKEEGRRGRR